jgi:putative endonuclease
MSRYHLQLGKDGEAEALRYLKTKGYKIIRSNFRSRLGQIDIIARDGDCLCFIEVKTRTSKKKGRPQEAIGIKKMRQLSKAALGYLRDFQLLGRPARFDVVSIALADSESSRIKLIKNAFELCGVYSY